MFKKSVILAVVICMVISMFAINTYAADPPSDKSVYFKDGEAKNCTVAESGSNMKSLISGDVLKLLVLGKSDPNINITLDGNVDTKTYKILAMKVKKEYDGATGGEIFYNEHGKGAEGGKSMTFEYAAGTDYQWIYIDLSSKSVDQVGFIRFDAYQEAPLENTLLTVAGIGFFKSVDDMNAYAASAEGKQLGVNEGDKHFPWEVPFAGNDAAPGVWLNTVPDATKPGNYWVRFNANAPFYGISYMLYASKNNPKGHWALYKYDTDIETTLAGTPVRKQDISANGDSWQLAEFEQVGKGQYVFYIELEEGQGEGYYYNVGVSGNDADPNLIETGFNGTNKAAKGVLSGSVQFIKTDGVTNYFAALDAENPSTGDVALFGYGIAALATVLIKKRKVK